MRWRRAAGIAAVIVGAAFTSSASPADATVDVRLTIHHSRFVPEQVTVAEGSLVRFVVTNTDPIEHELIVGDLGVQVRHERGTERRHGTRPGEVSLAPGETRATTIRLYQSAGPVWFGCHLPGHWDYGMQGVVRFVD